MDITIIRRIFATMILIDTDILISNITEAFNFLDTAVGSLSVWEIDLSNIEESFQELIQSIQESVDLVKDIQFFRSDVPVLAYPLCQEGHPLVQTLLVMTIHFRSNYREDNSIRYQSLNYTTVNRTLWT